MPVDVGETVISRYELEDLLDTLEALDRERRSRRAPWIVYEVPVGRPRSAILVCVDAVSMSLSARQPV